MLVFCRRRHVLRFRSSLNLGVISVDRLPAQADHDYLSRCLMANSIALTLVWRSETHTHYIITNHRQRLNCSRAGDAPNHDPRSRTINRSSQHCTQPPTTTQQFTCSNSTVLLISSTVHFQLIIHAPAAANFCNHSRRALFCLYKSMCTRYLEAVEAQQQPRRWWQKNPTALFLEDPPSIYRYSSWPEQTQFTMTRHNRHEMFPPRIFLQDFSCAADHSEESISVQWVPLMGVNRCTINFQYSPHAKSDQIRLQFNRS